MKTVENDDGIRKYATCPSSGHSVWASSSVVTLENINGLSLFAIRYEPKNMIVQFDPSTLEEMETKFLFKSSKYETHQYNTSSTGYQKGGNGVYWVFFNSKDKLIEYFKKYSTVVVSINGDDFVFSLSGFTSSYTKLFK
jgi:hypothetical protein